MTGPWNPDDIRWRLLIFGAMIVAILALMFGGQVFGQPAGDPRPNMQVFPVVTVDSSGRMVVIGDFANHALRVSVVGGISLGNVTVVNSVLPTGASTDVSVQNIEAAIREAQLPFGGPFATSGQAMAAIDPSGFMASLTVDNSGFLKVNVAAGGGSGGTSSNFAAAFPGTGTAAGFRNPSGFMASASATNNNALLVETIIPSTTDVAVKPGDAANNAVRVNVVAGSGGGPSGTIGVAYPNTVAPAGFKDGKGFVASAVVDNTGTLTVIASQGSANSGQPWFATGTITAHQGDTWTVSCTNCSGATTTNYGSTFPSAGAAIGVKDGAGRFASMVVDNASNLFVIASQSSSAWTVTATGTVTAHQGDTWNVNCTNCSGSSTTSYNAPFPSAGLAIGVKDGGGRFASMVVDNASNLFVIASQSSSAWTVTATGTVTAHQGDTWTVQSVQSTSPWVVSGTVTANTTPNATINAAYPATVFANFKDGTGLVASAVVDNASNLFVIASQGTANSAQPWFATGTMSVHQQDTWTVNATGTITAHQGDTWTVNCTNCSGASTTNYAAAFPAAGLAIGFKDGSGRFASAVVDNTGTLTVIASQGAANSAQPWFATGTISAHQVDGPWTINMAQYGGTTVVNGGTAGLPGVGGPTATGSQASGNPVRVGAVVRFATPSYTDGNIHDLTLTTSGSLRTKDDSVGATGSIAPSSVQIVGGYSQSATVTAVTVCDNFATVSLQQRGDAQIITGAAGHLIRICSIVLNAASATAINIVEGTGSPACSTNKTGVFGSTTTANGVNLSTFGGLTIGSGVGTIAKTQLTGSNLCIGNSTFATITGGIMWTRY